MLNSKVTNVTHKSKSKTASTGKNTPAPRVAPSEHSTKAECPMCGKRIKKSGLNDHLDAAHNAA